MTLLPELFDLFAALTFSVFLICAGRVVERLWPAQTDQPSDAIRFDLKYALVNVSASWVLGPFAGVVAVFLVNRAGVGIMHWRSDRCCVRGSLIAHRVETCFAARFTHAPHARDPGPRA